MDLDALEARYREAIEGLPPTKGNLRDYLLRRTLESRREHVFRTRLALAVERFDLVFIGKVGTGNRTADALKYEISYETTPKAKTCAHPAPRRLPSREARCARIAAEGHDRRAGFIWVGGGGDDGS